jgi:hypothetical protein
MFSRAPNAVHHPAIAGGPPNLSRKAQICSEETIRPALDGWSPPLVHRRERPVPDHAGTLVERLWNSSGTRSVRKVNVSLGLGPAP